MEKRADHMLLDHADGDAEPASDLGMGIAFELVHDERLAASWRQFVEEDGELGQLPALLITGDGIVGEFPVPAERRNRRDGTIHAARGR